jgi:hypothetical protein
LITSRSYAAYTLFSDSDKTKENALPLCPFNVEAYEVVVVGRKYFRIIILNSTGISNRKQQQCTMSIGKLTGESRDGRCSLVSVVGNDASFSSLILPSTGCGRFAELELFRRRKSAAGKFGGGMLL